MEEADLLADTIGVMSKGRMQAQGTSLELKQAFGTGYVLHLLKTDGSVMSEPIVQLIKSSIESASLQSSIQAELTFNLPVGTDKEFPDMFERIEQEKNSLGIASYGLSMTTLEEVFLTLAEKERQENSEESGENTEMSGDVRVEFEQVHEVETPAEGVEDFECEVSWKRQILAVLYQTMQNAKRYPLTYVLLVWQPIVFCLVAGLVHPLTKPKDPEPVLMQSSILADKFRNPIPYSVKSLRRGWTWKVTNDAQIDGRLGPTQDDELVKFVLGSSWPHERFTEISLTQGYSSFNIDDGYLSNAVNIQLAQNSTGRLLFKFNHTVPYSSRILLSNFWNSSSFFLSPGTFPEGIRCEYLVWAPALYQNSFGTGGIMYFVAAAFGLLSAFYAEEMVRIREVHAFCKDAGRMLTVMADSSQGDAPPLRFISHALLVFFLRRPSLPVLDFGGDWSDSKFWLRSSFVLPGSRCSE
eukprot:461573-Hanusia_phi.AAC.2